MKNHDVHPEKSIVDTDFMIRSSHYTILCTGGEYDLNHSTTQTAQFFAS